MTKNIFVLEDDLHIQELLKYNLIKNGYNVRVFSDPAILFSDPGIKGTDLFLLDIMLPGGQDGYQVCRKLKSDPALTHIPVIFLTAKSEEFDAVLGLELGAEDYIKKPFGIRELLARIKVVLRRSESEQPAKSSVSGSGIELDSKKHTVYKNGVLIPLTLKEFDLLKLLMENEGMVFTRDLLLERIWGYEYAGETRTVDVHIRYLRQKIEDDDKNPKHILTVRGVGYKFSDEKG